MILSHRSSHSPFASLPLGWCRGRHRRPPATLCGAWRGLRNDDRRSSATRCATPPGDCKRPRKMQGIAILLRDETARTNVGWLSRAPSEARLVDQSTKGITHGGPGSPPGSPDESDPRAIDATSPPEGVTNPALVAHDTVEALFGSLAFILATTPSDPSPRALRAYCGEIAEQLRRKTTACGRILPSATGS